MTNLKNKNILYLCSWYPTRIYPTSGNFIQKHARCLVDQMNIQVLTVCEDLKMEKRFAQERGSIDRVPHLIIYFRSPNKFLKPIYKMIAYKKGFQAVNQKWKKIDLIHLQVILDAGIFLWFYSFFQKTPFVATEHSSSYLKQNWYRFSKLKRLFIRKIMKGSRMILPVSKNLEENMRLFGVKNEYEVVPNIVNTDLFNLKKKREGDSKIRFIHISDFHQVKNIKGILRCVKKLSKTRSDFSITIAGDGDLKSLKKYVNELQIEYSFVRFHGRMTEEEVAGMMKTHDVFLLFSDTENLPVVLLEAQSCGLAIISSDIGGTAEIVDHAKYGVLVQPKDEENLLLEMNRMIDNYNSYNPTEIRKRAVMKYSERMIKQNLIEVYKKALNIK